MADNFDIGISDPDQEKIGRRNFFRQSVGRVLTLVLGLFTGFAAGKSRSDGLVWQIDPDKCVQCGQCATDCVLSPSAVKCVQSYPICGYCNLCFGYFEPDASVLNASAENQLCPTGAIKRTFVEDPYWDYTIDESECIACAKCVKACEVFGNGSFFLQIRHDQCINCNECSIAKGCPSDSFRLLPEDKPYLIRGQATDKFSEDRFTPFDYDLQGKESASVKTDQKGFAITDFAKNVDRLDS